MYYMASVFERLYEMGILEIKYAIIVIIDTAHNIQPVSKPVRINEMDMIPNPITTPRIIKNKYSSIMKVIFLCASFMVIPCVLCR